MDKFPLNLIIFATTMGHGGRHTYTETVGSLFSQVNPKLFANKVMHLKAREGEDDVAEEIEQFCCENNIRLIKTTDDVVHHSESHLTHSAQYFKDIFKAYSDPQIRKTKYSLWLEDDWVLRLGEIKLADAISQSISFLEDDPDQLCVRFNSSKEPEGNYIVENENIFTQAKDFTKYGPAFSFQPNINRTSEIFLAWKTLQNYLYQLGTYHCELMASHLLIQNFSNSETPFSFFNPEKAHSRHIG
tara:strand:+ start:1056 stop:1787 length:732 start_codon:yes stop_codon:yes gene_type:complete